MRFFNDAARARFRARLLRSLAVLLVPIGIAACQSGTSRPNILLISLDACRSDHLSCYGRSKPTSPFMDGLSQRGVRFSNAFVNTLGTTPSHTTILSSLYQQTHRVEFGYGEYEVPMDALPSSVTLAQEIFQRSGYNTIGVVEGGRLSAGFGFDRGFDRFDDKGGDVKSRTSKFLEFLREMGMDKPVFALFHTAEIHSPYEPPEAYRDLFGHTESDFAPSNKNLTDAVLGRRAFPSKDDLARLEELYDGEIRYTDDELRKMFGQLDAMGFLDNCLVVITADHGEEFGEHGGLSHRGLLYDELIHVPLILWGKGVPSGQVIDHLVSSVDITPTMLRFAGLEPLPGMEGRDLLDPSGRSKNDVVLAQFRDLRYAARTREWKLIASTNPLGIELFDLIQDPAEQNDLADQRRDVVMFLTKRIQEGLLRKTSLGRGPTVTPGPEQLERLKSLGYIDEEEEPSATKPPNDPGRPPR